MPSPAVYGALLGLGVQLYANAVRKLPLMRTPWQHAAWMGAGAAFGTWLVDFNQQTEEELAVLLRQRAEANKNITESS